MLAPPPTSKRAWPKRAWPLLLSAVVSTLFLGVALFDHYNTIDLGDEQQPGLLKFGGRSSWGRNQHKRRGERQMGAFASMMFGLGLWVAHFVVLWYNGEE